jgi:hypothetical protein
MMFVVRILFLLAVCSLCFSCAGPRIDSFTPRFGPPGAEVTVLGERLAAGDPATTTAHIGLVDQPDRNASYSVVAFRVAENSVTGLITIANPSGLRNGTQ